jgi:deoxyguanosine kinase
MRARGPRAGPPHGPAVLAPAAMGWLYSAGLIVDYRYLAIEGPVGVGKTALAERLAVRIDATAVLEETENPFMADFYQERPGAALQTQLFFLLNRHRQLSALRQADLFSQVTICDYLFDKDRIYAYLNLDDNELFIYERLYELLARDVPAPDLVVYLQAPTDMLVKRLRDHRRDPDSEAHQLNPTYIKEMNEAYQHFFFHYRTTPLLVVETAHLDFGRSDETVDDLVRQIKTMGRGTQYYVPRTG